jgi:phosphatidylethanolamine/phosphatidyl-N-methylethanolamine N-methyltransferase
VNSAAILRAYRAQSPVYDLLFQPFYGPGQARALEAMRLEAGEKVLELGAGTGLSLQHYPKGIDLTCIDLSEAMLSSARKKAKALDLTADFRIMDAQALEFGSQGFYCTAHS